MPGEGSSLEFAHSANGDDLEMTSDAGLALAEEFDQGRNCHGACVTKMTTDSGAIFVCQGWELADECRRGLGCGEREVERVGFAAKIVLEQVYQNFAFGIFRIGFGTIRDVSPESFGNDESALIRKLCEVLACCGFLDPQTIGQVADGRRLERNHHLAQGVDTFGVAESFADIPQFSVGHDEFPFCSRQMITRIRETVATKLRQGIW